MANCHRTLYRVRKFDRRLLELKILIKHIVINDCSDFHLVNEM